MFKFHVSGFSPYKLDLREKYEFSLNSTLVDLVQDNTKSALQNISSFKFHVSGFSPR